jgi:methionine-rich copper-binding protein CopC
MNKITKIMTSLLLITLAVLVPASAATPALVVSQTVSGNGVSAMIATSDLVMTQDGVLTIAVDITNNVNVDYTLQIVVTGDGIDNAKSETINIEANLGQIAETRTAEFVLDSVLATGLHTVNVDLILSDVLQVQDQDDLDFDLTVNAVVPASLALALISDVDYEDELAPGDNVDLEIELDNTGYNTQFNDVVVEAYVVDADGDRVTDREETSEFNLADEEEETVRMTLALPEDLESGDYNVVISIDADEGHLVDTTYALEVSRDSHSLSLVSVQHDSTAQAGDTIDVAIRVLNNGENDEDNVVVVVSMAGTTQTSAAFTIEEGEEAVRYFTLSVPSNAEDYEVLTVLVTGDDTVARYSSDVNVGASTTVSSAGLSATVDSVSKTIGENGATYMITLTNNDDSTRTVGVSAGGVQGWAEATVTPATLTLAPGSSGIASVYINPASSAEGTNAFTVYVSEGNQVISSVGLTATIDDAIDTMSMILAGIALVIVFMAYQQRTSPKKGRRSRKAKRVYY